MTRVRLRHDHALLRALVVAAILVKALVPVGWMAAADARGIRVELCSGWRTGETAPILITFDTSKSGDHGSDEDDAQQPCTFAAAASGWVAPASPDATFRFAPVPAEQPILRPPSEIGRGLAAPPPPATGPPSRS